MKMRIVLECKLWLFVIFLLHFQSCWAVRNSKNIIHVAFLFSPLSLCFSLPASSVVPWIIPELTYRRLGIIIRGVWTFVCEIFARFALPFAATKPPYKASKLPTIHYTLIIRTIKTLEWEEKNLHRITPGESWSRAAATKVVVGEDRRRTIGEIFTHNFFCLFFLLLFHHWIHLSTIASIVS